MSFNGSGTYVPPAGQPVAAGTVIQSSTFNTLVTDIGNTFNNVLPRDGQAAMSAPFKLIDGTSSVPGIAFNSEASTGIYRPTTGTLALVASGVENLRINGSGRVMIGTTADDGINRLQVNGPVQVTGTLAATSYSGPLTGNVTGNVTGTASNVTGIVAIATGGTGSATVAGALANLGAAPIASPTFTGTVGGITATMVGLGNVTNTSDTAKPISTAQQNALNLKADKTSLDQMAASGGAALVGYGRRTVAAKLAEIVTLTDVEGIVADGIDRTTEIVAWLGTLAAGYDGSIIAPYGLRFNADTVYDALPLRAILIDNSAINSWDTTGSRARVVTLGAERGDTTAVVDMTTILASSGHNASTGLDNRGTAGSHSASGLVAAFQWFSGRLKKGQAGLRQLARWEWAKLDGTNSWVWVIRKFVPWAARNWEYWYPSTAYSAGATILTNAGRTYSTTAGGTSGTVEPSHASGTAVDGTISWTYLQASNDQSLFVVNENGEISTNTTPLPGYVAYFKASADSDGSALLVAEATGASKRAELRLIPTNASGAVLTAIPTWNAESNGKLRLRTSTYTDLLLASDTGGLQLGVYGHKEATAADGDTTPSVANCGFLILVNTSATSITMLDDATATQEATLFSQNGNTTLVHNAGSFLLKGGINATLAANTMIVMKRYSASGAWFEKSRSF